MKNAIKTKWDFKIFYTSDTDKQIQSDFDTFERAVLSFEKKYKNTDTYLVDNKKLLLACQEYEKLTAMPEGEKPLHYFLLRRDSDFNNKFVVAKVSEYTEKINKLHNKILFFKLKLGNIEKELQKKFLADDSLSPYHYFLKKIFNQATYALSEPEEKIMTLMDTPAYSLWTSGFSKVLNNQEVTWKGNNLPINEAFGLISSLSTKDRRAFADVIYKKLMSIADFSESELNAIITGKKISDELRGYDKPYTQTIRAYENEEKVIEGLVATVTNNFKIAHRFYKLKAKLLKENKLQYADRGAKIGSLKKNFSFDETVKILSSAFSKFDPKYEKIFNEYLNNGQVDVFPAKGKKGGAYCWGCYGAPTVVLLNHTNDFHSVITFGHEMGHAFHTEMSHTQKPMYVTYTFSVAETASTLFENFVFEEVFETLSEKEKIIALHDKINESITTIFRQIACFNFENELHQKIREVGYLSKEDIALLMNKHMKSYLGPVFDLKDEEGYFFVLWDHIRRFFYVYSYAFGALISDALYVEYKKDKNFREKIEQFLSAGGSKSPEDIFADIGLDIRNPKFFENGLKVIEEDIKKLEKLVK